MLCTSLGWSLTRDALSRREHRLLVVIFAVYFAISLIKAMCDAQDDLCKAYLLTEYVIKSLLMLGVIVALNFSVSQLRLLLTEARWNNRVTPVTYMKLHQFQLSGFVCIGVSLVWSDVDHCSVLRRFRGVFLLYLMFPTCLLILNVRCAWSCVWDGVSHQTIRLQLLVITPPGTWRYDWVNYLLAECCSLLLYGNVGLILRPLDPYCFARVSLLLFILSY